MDKELIDIIVSLKIESKTLRLLVDTILDSCRIAYGGEGLRIDNDDRILTIVKAFYGDEYIKKFNDLKEEA